MKSINYTEKPTKKVLVLGCCQSQTKIIDALVAYNGIVDHTGPIVKQRFVNFEKLDFTFATTYGVLIENIESLSFEFSPLLPTDTWTAEKKRGIGTNQYASELQANFAGWGSVITEELFRLNKEGLLYGSQ